ncbi:MAG: phosphoribosylamine--glycine ligase [Spirochaetaceae bacterium]|nr:phosphoribosylamine--glycine ligase [Spirochaetaceae bacterium]
MRILIIGSGGREHAMAWKFAQSEKVEKVFIAPGNGGTAGEKHCENVDLLGRDPAKPEIQEALIRYAVKVGIDLSVIGPEAPLASGIADRFRSAGLAVLGPGAEAARLEASKDYAKSFMKKYGVRTAQSLSFTRAGDALEGVRTHFKTGAAGRRGLPPLVIKADGLAAGKGVVIAGDITTAKKTVTAFMEEGLLGAAGKTLLLEEFLQGPEVSVLAAVSAGPGTKGIILPFVSARDHKRRLDNDEGPNTGGMGAIAPAPGFSGALQRDFEESILTPTLAGIEAEGFTYRGFIFFGLVIRDTKCYLLEYNVRLGDPETQAVLPLLDSDFAGLCAAVEGGLQNYRLSWKPGAVCAPVAVASGYPGTYRTGDAIAFNEAVFAKTRAVLFAAGAVRGPGGPAGSGLRTAGGRVLTVAAHGSNRADARERAYRALGAVSFEGMAYRRDIGADA